MENKDDILKGLYGIKEELSKENTLLEKDQKSILEEIEVLNELKNINEAQRQTNTANSLTFHRIEHHRAAARPD